MKKYTVALLGCGQMGAAHLENIYCKENVYIKYACDLDIQRAEDMQRRFFVEKATTDANVCIRDTEVDIVIIATYPETHTKLLEACLLNHKHVICEKPIASTKEDAVRFVELAQKHKESKVIIGHVLRHNLTYNKVAQLIRNDIIGHPLVMRMVQNHHPMNWNRYKSLITQTSPIIDCGVHYFDVMKWFTGEEIVKVNGISNKLSDDLPDDKYDYGMVTLNFSNGSVGYYEAAWCKTASSENTKEFIGPKGRIRITYEENRINNREEGDLVEVYHYPEGKYEIINCKCKRKPTDLQFDYLIEMIEKNAPAKPTLDEALDCCLWTFKADEVIS